MKDPWRHKHPSQCEYSYFSQPHNSFSHYFLIDSKLITAVKSVQYEAIVLSDHAPLKLQLAVPIIHTGRTQGIDRLLSDKSITEYIKSQIMFYVVVNNTTGVSIQVLWEAMKIFVWGQIISHNAQEAEGATTDLLKKKHFSANRI